MKRLALLTIPLIAAFAIGSATAYTAFGATVYPESDEDFIRPLTFSSLTDYAIEDDLFVFADGKLVKVYEKGNYDEYECTATVKSVDIDKGVIYCLTGDVTYYLGQESDENGGTVEKFLPDPKNHTFATRTDEITYNGYYYFTDSEGLTVFSRSTKEYETYSGEFFNLKQCGDKVYAICNNVLHEFSGTADKPLDDLKYMIDASDVEITVGQATSLLKEYSSAKFVNIAAGAIMTEIDLDDIPVDGHFTSKNLTKTEKETPALMLCETGDFTIVSILDTAYAVLSSNIEKSNATHTNQSTLDSVQITGTNIYASPFMSTGTTAYPYAHGIMVEVIGEIKFEGVLERVFYEVRYEYGDTVIEGFIADGFWTTDKREDKSDPYDRKDPNETYKSDTKTILIILAVVLLVLAVIAYLVHLSAKHKKKGKKKKEEQSEE